MADKRPTKTKLSETKIDLELPTSKGELVPYKKPEGGLSDTSQGKRATRNIAKGRGSAKRRAFSALLEILLGTAVNTEPLPGPEIDRRTVLKGIGHGLTSLVTPNIPFKLGDTPKPELLELGTEILGKQLGSSLHGGLPQWMQTVKLDVDFDEFRKDLNDELRQFEGTATDQDPDTYDLLQYDTAEGPEWGKEVIKTILSPEGYGTTPPEGSLMDEEAKDKRLHEQKVELYEKTLDKHVKQQEIYDSVAAKELTEKELGFKNPGLRPPTKSAFRQNQRQNINRTLKEVVDTIYSPHTPKKIRDRLISNPFGVEISNMKKQGMSQKEIYKLLSKNNPGFKDIISSPDWLLQDMIPFKHVETPEGSDYFVPLHALEFIGLRSRKNNKDIIKELRPTLQSKSSPQFRPNHSSSEYFYSQALKQEAESKRAIDHIRDIGWLETGIHDPDMIHRARTRRIGRGKRKSGGLVGLK